MVSLLSYCINHNNNGRAFPYRELSVAAGSARCQFAGKLCEKENYLSRRQLFAWRKLKIFTLLPREVKVFARLLPKGGEGVRGREAPNRPSQWAKPFFPQGAFLVVN